MTIDHRELFERYVSALNRRDAEHLGQLFTEDVVIEYPQSGEVIRGQHNLRALIEGWTHGAGSCVEGRSKQLAKLVVGYRGRIFERQLKRSLAIV